jgi:ABC-2 type transport system ATP-binding protein
VTQPVIEARELHRRFGRLHAVQGIDLTIGRGEVFGFLGPNGAGKSTLLRMLVGVMAPTSGTVRVLGYEMPRQADALRPSIGYMTQRFSLYGDLTVEENLRFAGEVFGFPADERQRRVEAAIATYGLARRRRQLAEELSGGWKQRLALAAATVHQPEILVLDEPTAGVDPSERRNFWEQIFELSGDGVTVLVSTHYMDEAVRCHRLALLRRGTLVALGEPRALAGELEGRVVEVDAEPPEEVVRLLRKHPEVASVTQLGDRVHALLAVGAQAEWTAPRLTEHLHRCGFEDAVAVPARPGLEDVFVAATQSAPAASGAYVDLWHDDTHGTLHGSRKSGKPTGASVAPPRDT